MRVLVVDDDADFALLVRKMLEQQGHVVDTANSAFGLVNRAAGANGTDRPDVLLIDCGLPGLSGASVVELLSKDRRTADLPVVLTSAGHGDNAEAALSTHSRAIFVPKDGHFKELVERIEEHASSFAPAVVKS